MSPAPRIPILAIVLSVAASHVLCADTAPALKNGTLSLRAGDYRIILKEKSSWTMIRLDYRQALIVGATGANGPVANLKAAPGATRADAWSGTGHGGEQVESVVLEVDGVAHPIVEPFTPPAGAVYAVVKKSRLGPLEQTSRLELSAKGVRESYQFKAPEGTGDINFLYPFMHCFNKQMTHWCARLANGETREGQFLGDDSWSLQQDVAWLAVYSEELDAGVVVTYAEPYPGSGFKNVFRNRDIDNKHYFRADPAVAVGKTAPYICTIRGFKATKDDWHAVASDLAHSHLPQEAR